MTAVNWAQWRPVLGGLGELVAVQTLWSIDDLCDAHEVLDIKEEMEQHILERTKRE